MIAVGEVLQRSEKTVEFAIGGDITLTVILGQDPATVGRTRSGSSR